MKRIILLISAMCLLSANFMNAQQVLTKKGTIETVKPADNPALANKLFTKNLTGTEMTSEATYTAGETMDLAFT